MACRTSGRCARRRASLALLLAAEISAQRDEEGSGEAKSAAMPWPPARSLPLPFLLLRNPRCPEDNRRVSPPRGFGSGEPWLSSAGGAEGERRELQEPVGVAGDGVSSSSAPTAASAPCAAPAAAFPTRVAAITARSLQRKVPAVLHSVESARKRPPSASGSGRHIPWRALPLIDSLRTLKNRALAPEARTVLIEHRFKSRDVFDHRELVPIEKGARLQ